MEFMPENAPVVFLGFLFTAFLLLGAAFVVMYSFAVGKQDRARKVLAAAVVVAGIYAGLLLTFSLSSREKVLGPGELKYFCEIDCHLAYSVVALETKKSLGTPPKQKKAQGVFYVVTVKTWFDERTISSHRPRDLPLRPNRRALALVDEEGKRYQSSAQGQQALEAAQGPTVPLTQALRPGESYTTTLVFDLPAESKNPRLWIGDANWLMLLAIGHENSFFHKKIFFRLRELPRATQL